MKKINNMQNMKKEYEKKSYKEPVLKKVGNVSKFTAGIGNLDFDNGSNARAGKTVS